MNLNIFQEHLIVFLLHVSKSVNGAKKIQTFAPGEEMIGHDSTNAAKFLKYSYSDAALCPVEYH